MASQSLNPPPPFYLIKEVYMKTKIALSIWLIILGLIFWLGIDLYNGIVEQIIPIVSNTLHV